MTSTERTKLGRDQMEHIDLAKLIHEASGGAAKLISGRNAEELLSNVKAAMNDSCGNPNCQVHGAGSEDQPTSTLDGIDIDNMSLDDVLRLATLTACAAQIKLETGEAKSADRIQEQAFLWLQIHQQMLPGELQGLRSVLAEGAEALRIAKDRIEELDEANSELRAENQRLQDAMNSNGTEPE